MNDGIQSRFAGPLVRMEDSLDILGIGDEIKAKRA